MSLDTAIGASPKQAENLFSDASDESVNDPLTKIEFL